VLQKLLLLFASITFLLLLLNFVASWNYFPTPTHEAQDFHHIVAEKNDDVCILPEEAKGALSKTTNLSNWKTWVSPVKGIQFQYPPTWSILENSQQILVIPNERERFLGVQGDNFEPYGIKISTTTGEAVLNSISSQDVKEGLPSIRVPIQTRWIRTESNSILLAYCIFEYSEGVSGLVVNGKEVIHVAISRFFEGRNTPDDWKTFFGILKSFKLLPLLSGNP